MCICILYLYNTGICICICMLVWTGGGLTQPDRLDINQFVAEPVSPSSHLQKMQIFFSRLNRTRVMLQGNVENIPFQKDIIEFVAEPVSPSNHLQKKNKNANLLFLSDPGVPGVRSMGPDV